MTTEQAKDITMEFTVDAITMRQAILAAEKIAPSASPIELLRCVYIESSEDRREITLYANSFASAISITTEADVKVDGSMAINARLLLKILDKACAGKSNAVRFSQSSKTIFITFDTCNFKLPTLQDVFPKPKFDIPEETSAIGGAQLYKLVKNCAFAAAGEDASRDILKCVSVGLMENSLSFTASDGFCLARVLETAENDHNKQALVPAAMLAQFSVIAQHYDDFRVGITDKWLVFQRSNMIVSIMQVPGTYIDVDVMLKCPIVYRAEVDAGGMYDAISAAVLCSEGQPVKLTIKDSLAEIESTGDTYMRSTLRASKTSPSAGMQAYFRSDGLQTALRGLSGIAALSFTKEGHMFVRSEKIVFFQTATKKPMAKKEKETKKSSAEKAA